MDNYDYLMVEDGILLKDMVYLKQSIRPDFMIRTAKQTDIAALRDLFRNTVIAVNRRNYSQAEVEDWASCGDDLPKWVVEMVRTHYFIVAVNRQSEIVGFSSIPPQGYLHSMFVHKDYQGKGIARITSEVSLTARPFFEKRGYIVEVEQKRRANRFFLTNFRMAKESEGNGPCGL